MTSANQASNGTHVIILPFKLEVHRLKICLEVFATILLVFLLTINCFNHVAYGESAKAYLLMTPPACIAKEIGELFDVAINISSVENLRSVGFTVTYNASLLNVEQIAEGSFFPAPQDRTLNSKTMRRLVSSKSTCHLPARRLRKTAMELWHG
jgi:hypothetical protein